MYMSVSCSVFVCHVSLYGSWLQTKKVVYWREGYQLLVNDLALSVASLSAMELLMGSYQSKCKTMPILPPCSAWIFQSPQFELVFLIVSTSIFKQDIFILIIKDNCEEPCLSNTHSNTLSKSHSLIEWILCGSHHIANVIYTVLRDSWLSSNKSGYWKECWCF